LQNNLTEEKVASDIFDPDFFEKYEFQDSDLSRKQKALTLRRFMRDFLYGPDLTRHALIEIRKNNNKIFTGTLQKLLGIETLFPLVDIEPFDLNVLILPDKINLIAKEFSSGLIFHSQTGVNDFQISDLKFLHATFEKIDFISSIQIRDKMILSTKNDSLIRGRSFVSY
jgi:hypothetical protein